MIGRPSSTITLACGIAVGTALGLASCGSPNQTPVPVVGQIDDALAAIEQHYGEPQEFFEVSADLERVRFVVAVDGATAAEQGSYQNGDLHTPEPVGDADGSTFLRSEVVFDHDSIFEQIQTEIDDPVIIDFAIQGGPDGTVVYDATVASDGGGVILVLLAADGSILGAQAG